MGVSRNRHGLNLILAAILLLFVLLLFVQSTRRAAGRIAADFFYPFLAAPIKAERAVASRSAMLRSRADLLAALDASERLNLKQAAELTAFAELRNENRELRQLLGLRDRAGMNSVFAGIILRDPLEWQQRFTIDKGVGDGITPGNLVVAGKMIAGKLVLVAVGRIGSVSHHTAEVVTLVARSSSLSVRLPAGNVCGLLGGGFARGNRLYGRIQYLPRDLDYLAGMTVVTSGLTPGTPADILVGRISVAEAPVKIRDNLYAVADVELDFDLNRMRFVMVLTGEKR